MKPFDQIYFRFRLNNVERSGLWMRDGAFVTRYRYDSGSAACDALFLRLQCRVAPDWGCRASLVVQRYLQGSWFAQLLGLLVFILFLLSYSLLYIKKRVRPTEELSSVSDECDTRNDSHVSAVRR